jgi:uncharacterized protein (DUF1810 family)
MDDPYDLQRFLDAQHPVYGRVRAELRAGTKSSHWMWYVFPQMKGLGYSATAQRYGMASLAEAAAYARHPVLGARLAECSELLLQIEGRTARQVLGSPDDLKLRSSMTLFERAAPEAGVFAQVLERYFAGSRDTATLDLL